MKTVMAFGTFDNLHQGHLAYLKQAKQEGDELIVIVARDINVKKIKGKKPQQSETARLKSVEKTGLADKASLGSKTDRLKPILKHKPDILFLGYDQPVKLERLREIYKGEILRGQPFQEEKYKSSKLISN